MNTAAVVEAVPSAEQTWPAPDFLETAMRLRREIETAIDLSKTLTDRIASIEELAMKRGLPPSLVVGGNDKLAKLSEEQNAAALAVTKKRNEFREHLAAERQRFYSLRDAAHMRLRPGISERFSRAQKAAKELRAALGDLLGAEAEAEREEKLIRAWNREVRKFNRLIPAVNVNAIPSAAGIGVGESCRTAIEGLILQDSDLREFCRESLAREAERRERIAANDEARIAQNEARLNPPD